MNRLRMITMCLLTMMMASLAAKAQEVTITLMPGWTWISFPGTEPIDFVTAMGSFTPVEGDVFSSQWGYSEYDEGAWFGDVDMFYPGYGYMYYSNRSIPVTVTFNAQQPAPQVVVTTLEPTDITTSSAVVGGAVTIEEGNHIYARGVCWDTVQMPTVDDNHTSNGTNTGVFSTTLTGLTPNTTYYVRAYVVTDYGLAYGEELSFNSGNHEYVDLGLPSGTLWATCNVGANSSEEYGDYFAWGEIWPKDVYNWSNYLYSNGGTPFQNPILTKYCNISYYGYNGYTDNLTILLPEDDAASANWGNGWRMPNKEEWQELFDNTTVTWTTQNGVNGRLFTAANSNSLFLPAAGYRYESSFYYVGSSGNYMSSSLDTDYPSCSWYFWFYSGGGGMFSDRSRDSGLSVRPVRSGLQN